MTLETEERNDPAKLAKRVFIVEDHPVFRDGLAQLINREKGLQVCGHAGDFKSAWKDIERLKPDLALIDISLPGPSGLDLIKKLRSVKHRPKMLAVSMHDEALYANRVLRLGGDGYIMKQENPREIINAMYDVLAGHIYVSEAVMASHNENGTKQPPREQTRSLDALTDSQLEILELLGQGKSNEEIARMLDLKIAEVETQCVTMRKRLKLASNNSLIRFAVCWVESGQG